MDNQIKSVMAVGTFDVLHLGHIMYLKQAKSMGDRLIVVVSSDIQAKKRGKTPHFNQMERQELVNELKLVDYSIIGDDFDIFKVVENLRPDYICLGPDATIEPEAIERRCSTETYCPTVVIAKEFDKSRFSSRFIKQKDL